MKSKKNTFIKGILDPDIRDKFLGKEKKKKSKKSLRPPSALQDIHQAKWSLANKFAAKFKAVAKIGFDRVAKNKNQTGVNWLCSHLMRVAISSGKTDPKIEYNLVELSRGPVEPAQFASIKLTPAGLGKLKWSNQIRPWEKCYPIRMPDPVYVVIYNETTEEILRSGFVGQRKDEVATFELQPFHHGDVLHGWMFYKSSENRTVSDSLYIPDIAIIMTEVHAIS